MDHRPFSPGELEVKPERLEDQQDIGEEDRRIDAEDSAAETVTSVASSGRLQSSRNGTFRGPPDTRPCTAPPAA